MDNKPLINIKAALKEKKIRQVFLAKILDVHPVTVNEVVSGKRKNPKIRFAIAVALGRRLEEIWPKEQKNTPAPAGHSCPSHGDGVGAPDPSRG